MRTYIVLGLLAAAACGNNPDPRVIAGGGIGDGDIDGTLNVYVIDNDTYQPIVDATVEIGSTQMQTDETGLVIFADLSGPQSLAIKATGYRGTVWQGANGANMTVPITKLGNLSAQQATVTGSIPNWDTITVSGVGHFKAALVGYSQSDDLGDPANNIKTPNDQNICIGPAACNFTVITRTGTVTLTAAIVDYDTKNTAGNTDDTFTVISWATAASFQVDAGVAQSGKDLTILDSAQLQNATIDYGNPPGTLGEHAALIGIELSNDEVVQLPAPKGATSVLVPLTSAFAPNATYRLTAIAQTTDGDMGPQSVVLRRGLDSTTLAASTWLDPPLNVTATRSTASFDVVSGAKLHSVEWSDSTGILLSATMFDDSHSVTIPDLVALTTSNAVTAKAQGLGADLDPKNFSLDTDKTKVWGVAAQPINVP